MKILVCITHVPDTVSKISFTENNTKFNTQNIQFIIGPYDDYALARGVELRDANAGSTLTVLNIGTAETETSIRKALAIGADDAIRIDAEPIDSLFVAFQIAQIAKKNNYDLILMGKESIDFNGNVVHGLVAEMLHLPVVSPIMKIEIADNRATISKEIEGGKEIIELNLPFVAGCQEPIAEWKIPSMRGIMSAKTKPYQIFPAFDTEIETKIIQYELPAQKSGCKMIDAETPEKLFELLKSEAKVL